MASQFGQQIYERRHELSVRLIEKLLGIKSNDENHALALDFCLQNEYHHSYADINPSTVESFYISVIQRLHEDSQLSKALALSALTTKFLSHELDSTTADLNHNVLQLLASLSGRPLDSAMEETSHLLSAVYQPAQDKTDELHQQQRAAVQRFKQLAAASSSVGTSELNYAHDSGTEAEYDPYGEDSDADSWDSDKDTGSHVRQLYSIEVRTSDVCTTTGDASTGDSQQPQHTSSTALAPQQAASWCLPVALLQAPCQLQPDLTMPQSSELLAQLAMHRINELPLMRPDPQFCFTESYLCKQLLYLLQGQTAQGFRLTPALQLDDDQLSEGAAPEFTSRGGILQQLFTPHPRATSPALSPAALQAVMHEFAAAGTASRQLAKLAQRLTQSRGKAWLPQTLDSSTCTASAPASCCLGAGGTAVTPCLRALGVALQQQLDLMGQQLAQLQQTISTEYGQSRIHQQQVSSLLFVKQQTRPIVQRLHMLHEAVFGVLQQLAGSSANVSATLLDGLYERAQAAALSTSGHQGAADAAALLHLLLCTCVPLVAALAQWLWSAADGRDTDSLLACPDFSQEQSADQQQAAVEGVNVCCEDFFIIRKSGVAVTDARFWHAAYDFSRTPSSVASSNTETEAAAHDRQPAGATAEGSITCPSFLLPFANSIMTAGKSVRLLEYMEQEQLRRSTATSARTPAVQQPAAGRRQSSSSTIQRGPRPQSSTMRAARVSSVGGAARKRWEEAASRGGPATDLTQQVRLQLAIAAGVAGQDDEQQLTCRFIIASSCLLQHLQHILQQQSRGSLSSQLGIDGGAAQQSSGQGSSSKVMWMALEAGGQQLAQVCGHSAGPSWMTAEQQQQQQQSSPQLGLRQALLLARKRRIAKQTAVQSSSEVLAVDAVSSQVAPQQPLQQQDDCQLEDDVLITDNQPGIHSRVCSGGSRQGVSSQVNKSTVDAEAAESEGPPPSAAAEVSSHLLQWKQQMDAKLLAAGQCLQQLAPWQHRQQKVESHTLSSPYTPDAPKFAQTSLGLLTSSCSKAPGSFSSSLAKLWPLKSSALADQLCQQYDRQSAHQGQRKWRAGGLWPCEQLRWLLLDPPQQIMPLAQLLDQALLHPVQARVDMVSRQLLSSLMGEWGLLQQLQGLVGVFLLASPAMVEWTDSCFAATEAFAAGKRSRMYICSDSPDSTGEQDTLSVTPAEADVALAAAVAQDNALEGYPAVSVDDLDVMELALLLQDICSSSSPEEILPDPSCLHLTINKKARLKHLQQPAQRQGQHVVDKATLETCAAGGLYFSAAEWASLSCKHSGTWQLSLVYNTEELSKFSKAWQFLLQLRWVRRRVDAARHAACKGSASIMSAAQQDAAEKAAVEAAYEVKSKAESSKYRYGAGSAADVTNWLSTRQELLLLQEISHFMARYQQFVMDTLIRGAWSEVQQALCQADTLDQVRAAAASFLHRVCTLCNCQWKTMGQKGIATGFAVLMNTALQAAAAAARLTQLRLQLKELGKNAFCATAQKAFLDLAAARNKLRAVQFDWSSQCSFWLSLLNLQTRARAASDRENAQMLMSALDVEEYYRRTAGVMGPPANVH